MNSQEKYTKLVDNVRKYHTENMIIGGTYTKKCSDSKQKDKEDFYMKWCPECEEINLWTYWQGKSNLKAEILLLGQDWATPWGEDGNFIEYVSRILGDNSGFSKRYIEEFRRDICQLTIC